MQWKCSINSSSLENRFHDEVVGSMNPEWIISKPLAKNTVALWWKFIINEYLGHKCSSFLHGWSQKDVSLALEGIGWIQLQENNN